MLCVLQVNITRDGCAVTKVCVETPDNCDPAGNASCLFGSVNASTPTPPNGTNLTIQLRGESTGYVALGLTVNASEVKTKTLTPRPHKNPIRQMEMFKVLVLYKQY